MTSLTQHSTVTPVGYLPDLTASSLSDIPQKDKFMTRITSILSLILAAAFIFFGVQKFGAENIVFETLAERSGIFLFEPYIRYLTGFGELVAAVLLIWKRSRIVGASIGLGLLIGAIGFHLSPWLGINVPTIGHGLFFTALAMFALTIVNFGLLRKTGAKLLFWKA